MKTTKLLLFLITVELLTSCAHLTQRQANSQLSAQQYLQLANSSSSPQKETYLITAAKRFCQNRQAQQALTILNNLDVSKLTPQQKTERNFTLAHSLILNRQYQDGLSTLNLITANSLALTQQQQQQWYQLAAQAFLGSGQPMQSINARNQLAQQLDPSSPQYQTNLQRIWSTLQQFDLKQLHDRQQPLISPNLKGWIDLALILEQPNQTQQQLINQLTQWQHNYPNHIANGLMPRNLSQLNNTLVRPTKIALLLPTTGPLASSSQAIRNGFTAAYYDAKSQQYQPGIVVLDTHNKDISTVYQNAIADGAQLVVGPLTKENVARLQQKPALPVPTIALNSPNGTTATTTNLYTFGLSPIDEATQAATKDWQDQHHRAIIITPKTPWGLNIARAFTQQWQQYGNTVTAQYNFTNRQSLSQGIKQLLQVSQSTQRSQQLKWLLHRKLRSIPRRRKDFDNIFLVANNTMARQIQPLIRYYYSGNIPAYAISQVYPGTPSINRDRDLNNLQFCDIPWVIRPKNITPPSLQTIRSRIASLWPTSFRQHPKLYALGVDSFNIASQLQRMILLPAFGTKAATGTLYVNTRHHIYRQLAWAKVIKGKIQPISDE